jgi:hypothetical protein
MTVGVRSTPVEALSKWLIEGFRQRAAMSRESFDEP